MPHHILITGAAGSGTTTLANALAKELEMTHLEADDYPRLPSERHASIVPPERNVVRAC